MALIIKIVCAALVITLVLRRDWGDLVFFGLMFVFGWLVARFLAHAHP